MRRATHHIREEMQLVSEQKATRRAICPGCLWAAWGAPDRAICARRPCALAAEKAAAEKIAQERRTAWQAEEQNKTESMRL